MMGNSSSNSKSKTKTLKENVTEKGYMESDINTVILVISVIGTILVCLILKALQTEKSVLP